MSKWRFIAEEFQLAMHDDPLEIFESSELSVEDMEHKMLDWVKKIDKEYDCYFKALRLEKEVSLNIWGSRKSLDVLK